VSVLASDYHWPALPAAALALARRGRLGLPEAWALVAANPAAAAGLADRGELRPGLRGDAVVVDPAGAGAVVATFAAGRLAWVSPAGAARLVAAGSVAAMAAE
jgi:alpha-D-ribose 1-methylphosphonate 5-triphosphate diphosphatase